VRKRRLVVCLLAAGALAGCIDEPRPFRPAEKPLPAALVAAEETRPVITVETVAGIDAPLGRVLADAMASALARRSLPASHRDAPPAAAKRTPAWRSPAVSHGKTSPDRVLYRVSAHFERLAPDATAIAWEVRDGKGVPLARYLQRLPLGASIRTQSVRNALLAGVAGEPAEMMVKGIAGDAALPPGTAAAGATPSSANVAHGRGLALGAIKGAPAKDGDVALRQTIAYALKTAGVRVVVPRTAESLLLDGTVATSAVTQGTEHVKVTWSVRRPDGTLVGEVSQENNVPTRLLERVWGEIASAVAESAAPGIAELVAEADHAEGK